MKSKRNSKSSNPEPEEGPVSLVIIDLDGTLLEGTVSSEKLFFRYLLKKRLLGVRQLGAFSYFFLRRFEEYGRLTPKKNKAYLTGLKEITLAEIAREFVGSQLMDRCCPNMRHRLDNHLAQGDVPVLVTGSLEMIARPVCSFLGIQHVRATQCAVEKGFFSAKPPLVHPFGQEKVNLGRAIGRELGFALKDATAYGNDRFDIPLLEAVARPVAVHPDRDLRRHALAHSWEIMEHTD